MNEVLSNHLHSARVGQELEVNCRYRPYRMEHRATSRQANLLGCIVVSIAGWSLDPVAYAAITIGAPRVNLAALVERNSHALT